MVVEADWIGAADDLECDNLHNWHLSPSMPGTTMPFPICNSANQHDQELQDEDLK